MTVSIGSSKNDYLSFLAVPRRIFLLCRSSSASTSYGFNLNSGTFYSAVGSATQDSANTWELLDFGYIQSLDQVIGDYTSLSSSPDLFYLTVTPGAGSATVDIDAILFMPVSPGGYAVGVNKSIPFSTSSTAYFLGSERLYYYASDNKLSSVRGELWSIPPGNKMSRFVYAITNSSSEHHLTDTHSISLAITPRTRHLLGTT